MAAAGQSRRFSRRGSSPTGGSTDFPRRPTILPSVLSVAPGLRPRDHPPIVALATGNKWRSRSLQSPEPQRRPGRGRTILERTFDFIAMFPDRCRASKGSQTAFYEPTILPENTSPSCGVNPPVTIFRIQVSGEGAQTTARLRGWIAVAAPPRPPNRHSCALSASIAHRSPKRPQAVRKRLCSGYLRLFNYPGRPQPIRGELRTHRWGGSRQSDGDGYTDQYAPRSTIFRFFRLGLRC